jgi:KTSC domain
MTQIDMQTVKSSNISKVGYDSETKTLAIEFVDGTLYHYDDVKKDVYDDLLAAKSMGRYVHDNIKRRFKFVKPD